MSDSKDGKATKPAFIDANRRGFLQGAAVAGGVAATGVASAAGPSQVQADPTESTTRGKGYELTDHVRKYYKRARF